MSAFWTDFIPSLNVRLYTTAQLRLFTGTLWLGRPAGRGRGPSQLRLLSHRNLIAVPQWLQKKQTKNTQSTLLSKEHGRPRPSLRCAAAPLFAVQTEAIRVRSAVPSARRGFWCVCEGLQQLPLPVGGMERSSRGFGGYPLPHFSALSAQPLSFLAPTLPPRRRWPAALLNWA